MRSPTLPVIVAQCAANATPTAAALTDREPPRSAAHRRTGSAAYRVGRSKKTAGSSVTATATTTIAAVSGNGARASYGDCLDHASNTVPTTSTPSASPSHHLLAMSHQAVSTPERDAVVAPMQPPATGASATARRRYTANAPRMFGCLRAMAHTIAEAPSNGSTTFAAAKASPLASGCPWLTSTATSHTATTDSHSGHVDLGVRRSTARVTPAAGKKTAPFSGAS